MHDPETLACCNVGDVRVAFPVEFLVDISESPVEDAVSLLRALELPASSAPSRWLRFAAPNRAPVCFQVNGNVAIKPLSGRIPVPDFMARRASKGGWSALIRDEDVWILLMDPFTLHSSSCQANP